MSLNIKLANFAHSDMLYSWACDVETRSNSFNSEEITIEEHIDWFKKKLEDANTTFYIVEDASTPISLVRFERKEYDTTIGITVAPAERGKGYAVQALNIACQEYQKKAIGETIIAYIKLDNLASVKSFKKAGFTQYKILNINGYNSIALKRLL